MVESETIGKQLVQVGERSGDSYCWLYGRNDIRAVRRRIRSKECSRQYETVRIWTNGRPIE